MQARQASEAGQQPVLRLGAGLRRWEWGSLVDLALVLAVAPALWLPRSFSALLLLVLPILWVVRWLRTGSFVPRTPLNPPLAWFVALLPLSFLAIADWPAATGKLFGVLAGVALLFAVAGAVTTQTRAFWGTVGYVVLLGGALAVLGLVGTDWHEQKLLPVEPITSRLPLLVRGISEGTARGGIHPNQTAGSLVPIMPVAAALLLYLLQYRVPYRRWLLLAVGGSTGLAAFVFVLTQSRGGFIATMVASLIVLLGWIWPQQSLRWRRLIAPAFGVLVLVAGLIGWRLIASWTVDTGPALDTLIDRVQLVDVGTTMLSEFPLTGVGVGQFSAARKLLYGYVQLRFDALHAHNFILQLGLDFGVPAAVAFLTALVAFLLAMRRVYQQAASPALRASALGLGAGMVGLLIFGLSDAVVLGARSAVSIWVGLGLGAGLATIALTRPREAVSADHDAPVAAGPEATQSPEPVGASAEARSVSG